VQRENASTWAACASTRAPWLSTPTSKARLVTNAAYAVIGEFHEIVPAIIEEIGRD
jgi:electron transfer flavoprotein alpha subunit